MRRAASISVSFLLLIGMVFTFSHKTEARAHYEDGLEEVLATAAPDSMIPLLVTFYDPLDPAMVRKEITGMSLPERREHVVTRLQDHLEEAAGDAISWIKSEARQGRADRLRPLWIAHSYVFDLRASRIPDFADHPQVAGIRYDKPVRFEDCNDEMPVADPGTTPVTEVVWGVEYIGAPALWAAGYRGRGVIIALIDTGVYTSHQDITGHVWVNEDEIPDNDIDDDDNGFVDDINGWNFYSRNGTISDVNGHGTKCAGVLVGNGTGGDTTGVAPEATLMVLRNWSSNWSSEATHPLAVQYAMSNGAHVISCSMSYDHEFNQSDVTHRTAQVFSLLSGMIQANSQGNNGNNPGPPENINPPGRCPPPWLHEEQELEGGTSAIMATGAFQSNGSAYTYSSRGPTEWNLDTYPDNYQDYPYEDGDEMGLLKPDISSPSGTRTTSRTGGYANFTGESAAAPHLGGALGLLRSIHQQATPGEICEAVKMSAEEAGDAGHDNRYGAGRLQVDAAHEYLDEMFDYGFLEVTVQDIDDSLIVDAKVVLNREEVRAWSDEEGIALMERVLPETYSVRVSADGFLSGQVDDVEITEGDTTEITVTLLDADVRVIPYEIYETFASDDTLEVQLTANNEEQDAYEAAVVLQSAGGMDWDAETELDVNEQYGSIDASGVVVYDSIITIVGNRPENDPMIWRFDMEGTLLDSMDQPDQFETGIQDLASSVDGWIFGGQGNKLFTFNENWEIIDSISVPFDEIKGVAYDDLNERFFVNGIGTGLYILDSNGNEIDNIDLPQSPVGLAYNPDDRYGASVYALNLGGEGLAQLSRIILETGLIDTLTDLAPDEADIGEGLDIDKKTGNPFVRVVTIQRSSGIRFFDRDVQLNVYSIEDTITVEPGGTELSFNLYGPALIPGDVLDLELLWARTDGEWEFVVPVDIEVISYGVRSEDDVALPIESELLAPFPNPFNATVQLAYRLNADDEVRLSIYNLLGQEVALIDQGRRSAGTYRFSWEAKEMATGLYIVTFKTSNERYAEKMLLVR
ncbi:MAG: S8 family serine peptidase [Candidatus Electryonea clarkiae]|nr:S8 family serine peptidase [Candidatus Electryonea clarkiae]MDP8288248.1 S8 family serine peptidase [Candidatus Electryonea clarkiae]